MHRRAIVWGMAACGLVGVYPMSLSVNDRSGLGAWGEEIELKADAIQRVN